MAADLDFVNKFEVFYRADIRNVNSSAKSWSFDDFKEACKSEKTDAYSSEVEEDYTGWEALLTLKRY